jgi:hypothetical protein
MVNHDHLYVAFRQFSEPQFPSSIKRNLFAHESFTGAPASFG